MFESGRLVRRWRWLVWTLAVVSTGAPLVYFPQLASVAPDHRCEPRAPNAAFARHLRGLSDAQLSRLLVPGHSRCAVLRLDACPGRGPLTPRDLTTACNRTAVPCPGPWVYDDRHSLFLRSYTQEFDLVCGRRLLRPLSAFLYLVGAMLGQVAGGSLADRHGRRPVAIATGLAAFWTALAVPLAPGVGTFTAARFVTGLGMGACCTALFTLCCEITDAAGRNLFNAFCSFYSETVAVAAAAALAFLLQDWRWYHISISVQMVYVFLFFRFLPESPVWLASHGRGSGTSLISDEAERAAEEAEADSVAAPVLAVDEKDFGLPTPGRHIFVACLVSFLQAMSFMGVSFYAVRVASNPYSASLLTAGLRPLCLLIAYLCYARFDRHRPLAAAYGLAGAVCLLGVVALIMWPDGDGAGHRRGLGLTYVAAPMGALSCTITAGVMWKLYVVELFPTDIRSRVVGLTSAVSRAGSAAAMLVESLDEVAAAWTPMLCFAVANFLCFVLLLMFIRTSKHIKKVSVSTTKPLL